MSDPTPPTPLTLLTLDALARRLAMDVAYGGYLSGHEDALRAHFESKLRPLLEQRDNAVADLGDWMERAGWLRGQRDRLLEVCERMLAKGKSPADVDAAYAEMQAVVRTIKELES